MATTSSSLRGRTQDERFDELLCLARRQGDRPGGLERALRSYWEARRVAQRASLPRLGEADLAIGLVLIELDRVQEGLEAVRRATRYGAKHGQIRLRGCAEVVLADTALRSDRLDEAVRHFPVASDLLRAAGDAEMAAGALRGRAVARRRQGRSEEARELLRAAEKLGDSGWEKGWRGRQ